ncbi:cytochrome c oxidase subunit 1 [Ceratobasidium sp. 428]|nr:cytochrome c oxidase subunit 1 [Ceratobasidium sp. 428]
MTITPINVFSQSNALQVFHNLNGSSRAACRHRALVVAVQYDDQVWLEVPRDGYTRLPGDNSMKLEGCLIDAEDIVELLRESGDYHDHNIRVLADIPSLPASQQPTKQNILDGIEWLVDGCRSEDFRFFYYAGHGVQIQDYNGDEVDGLDEGIFTTPLLDLIILKS